MVVAQQIAGRTPPIALTADRLDQMEIFTKTLFVQFRESAPLRRMFEAARASSPPSTYVLNPHLSLLYSKLTAVKRQELCETLAVPMGDYSFDRIRMVETELPIEDDGPVRRWRVVGDEPLLGS